VGADRLNTRTAMASAMMIMFMRLIRDILVTLHLFKQL
jgi:hypothetical protein